MCWCADPRGSWRRSPEPSPCKVTTLRRSRPSASEQLEANHERPARDIRPDAGRQRGGSSAPLASHVLYADAPALVIRCPTCQEVVLRYGQIGNRMRLDLIGITSLVVDLGET